MAASPLTPIRAGAQALEALASPARQELVSALREGPATVRELGRRLGRSRQALYYHLATLVGAGLVRVTGERGTGRSRERVYELASGRLAVGARAGSPPELDAAERAAKAMLRLSGRELAAALRSGEARPTGAGRETLAMRGKARLDPKRLKRLNTLIDQIATLLSQDRGQAGGDRVYALTIVLTPAREAADAAGSSPTPRKRKSR